MSPHRPSPAPTSRRRRAMSGSGAAGGALATAWICASFVSVCAASSPPAARAEADAGHGAYGRFDADLVLALDVGGGLRTDGTALLAGDLRARFLDSAGLVLGVERSFGDEGSLHVVTAIEVRPLFLMRFFLDAEAGDAWLDLFLDSFGLELGVAWADVAHERRGAALAAGLGIELPIVLRRSRGVALRLALRHVGAGGAWQDGPTGGVRDTSFVAALVLRTAVSAGIASAPR